MERPAQRYFCNKCGYVGNVDLHPGCGYLAYHLAPFEQNYIDQLEKELADIKKLAASPASAQEGWKLVPVEPTREMYEAFELCQSEQKYYAKDYYKAMLASAPTTPVSECVDPVMTKEELIAAAESIGMRFTGAAIPPVSEDRKEAERFRDGWTHSCNALCMEIELWIDRCPHCGRPAPKSPAMQEDKP